MTTQPAADNTSAVATIQLGVCDAMSSTAQRLVRDKFIMDKAVADQGASMLARDLHDGSYGPHEPHCFLRRVLPFFFLRTSTSASRPALVPTANTLGCCWRRNMKTFGADDVPAMVGELTRTTKLLDGSLDTTSYAWIKPLGLIAPMEGKNRVDFLRSQGIDHIPANVTEYSYPSPERLSLYSIKVHGYSAIWAVLDGRWVMGVENPSWAVPMMEAYGAGVRTSWPSDFPAPERVMQALFSPRGTTSALGHPGAPDEPIVDLDTLKATEAYLVEPILATVTSLNSVRIEPRFWLITGCLAILGLLGLALAPGTWDTLRLAAAMVFSGALTAAILPFAATIVLTQRRYATKQPLLPLERSPKHQTTRSRCLD